jgi:hypothetical protein
MLLLRQEIVALLLENGDVGTAKQVESTLPQLVNTSRDEDLLIELGVNIEHNWMSAHNDGAPPIGSTNAN